MKAILAGYALLLALVILAGCSAVTNLREYNLYLND